MFLSLLIKIMICYSFYKKRHIIVILGFFFISFFLLYWNYYTNYEKEPEMFNYFGEIESRRNVGLLLDPEADCKILNISPWDAGLRTFLQKLPEINCDPQGRRHWIYVNKTSLMVNKSAIAKSGFSFNSISCCFHTIHRVSESQKNYSGGADDQIEVSKTCTEIKEEKTEMLSEFVKVICKGKYWPILEEILYQQYFMLALPHKNLKTLEKVEFWRNSSKNVDEDQTTPPNILLLGIDSLSRLNFRRNMPKTRQVLEKIDAIEILGYTKVGDNTFPNTVPLLSGYLLNDLKRICYFNQNSPQDYCPYIWRNFHDSKYLTALIDDQPIISGFNLKKLGFVEQPTDFYTRPLTLAKIWKWGIETTRHVDDHGHCFGHEKSAKVYLNYIADLLDMSESVKTPIFIYSWQGLFSHDDINGPQLADEEFAQFLSKDWQNTLIVFLSDHGYRHGRVRNTFAGWLEDKLPNIYFVLSQDLKMKYPEWIKNLQYNSRKLTSPLDIYQTMSDILEKTSKLKIPPSEIRDGGVIQRSLGQSLILSQISNSRDCSNAGIPTEYCACSIPKEIPPTDSRLRRAGLKSVEYINSQLPQECSKLALKSIQSGAILDMMYEQNDVNKLDQTNYIVSFMTQPGDFLFESHVLFHDEKDNFEVKSNVQRINKMTRDVSCTKDSVIELYCYCLNV